MRTTVDVPGNLHRQATTIAPDLPHAVGDGIPVVGVRGIGVQGGGV